MADKFLTSPARALTAEPDAQWEQVEAIAADLGEREGEQALGLWRAIGPDLLDHPDWTDTWGPRAWYRVAAMRA